MSAAQVTYPERITTTLYEGPNLEEAFEAFRKDAAGRASVWLFRRKVAGIPPTSVRFDLTASHMETLADSAFVVPLENVLLATNRIFESVAKLAVPRTNLVRYDFRWDDYRQTFAVIVTETIDATSETKAPEEA